MKFRKTDSVMTGIAAITGLAVGAVIGALFAPESGRNARKKLADAINGIIAAPADYKEIDIKDHIVEDVRTKVKTAADQLTGATDELPDLTKTTLKQTGPKSRQLPIESSEA